MPSERSPPEFPVEGVVDAHVHLTPDRLMYGSDYPNIPYRYEKKRAHLLGRNLPAGAQRDSFARTARQFLDEPDT